MTSLELISFLRSRISNNNVIFFESNDLEIDIIKLATQVNSISLPKTNHLQSHKDVTVHSSTRVLSCRRFQSR